MKRAEKAESIVRVSGSMAGLKPAFHFDNNSYLQMPGMIGCLPQIPRLSRLSSGPFRGHRRG